LVVDKRDRYELLKMPQNPCPEEEKRGNRLAAQGKGWEEKEFGSICFFRRRQGSTRGGGGPKKKYKLSERREKGKNRPGKKAFTEEFKKMKKIKRRGGKGLEGPLGKS